MEDGREAMVNGLDLEDVRGALTTSGAAGGCVHWMFVPEHLSFRGFVRLVMKKTINHFVAGVSFGVAVFVVDRKLAVYI